MEFAEMFFHQDGKKSQEESNCSLVICDPVKLALDVRGGQT